MRYKSDYQTENISTHYDWSNGVNFQMQLKCVITTAHAEN